jgi:hypothetical protein
MKVKLETIEYGARARPVEIRAISGASDLHRVAWGGAAATRSVAMKGLRGFCAAVIKEIDKELAKGKAGAKR